MLIGPISHRPHREMYREWRVGCSGGAFKSVSHIAEARVRRFSDRTSGRRMASLRPTSAECILAYTSASGRLQLAAKERRQQLKVLMINEICV